jgi:hypothetical protein
MILSSVSRKASSREDFGNSDFQGVNQRGLLFVVGDRP